MMLKIFIDVVGIAGVAAISYGAMMIYFPLVYIVPGVCALTFSILASQ